MRKNGAINTSLIKSDEKLINEIKSKSNIKSDDIRQHIFHYLNPGATMICSCGDELKFNSVSKGYSATCGNMSCRQKSIENKLFIKYGVTNVWQMESVKQKSKQTNLKKYGVEYPTQNKHIIDIRNKNNIEKYGTDPSRLDSTKQKIKQTNLKKYGVEYSSMLESNRILCKNTRKKNENLKRPGRIILDDITNLEQLVHNKNINLSYLAKKYDVDGSWLGKKVKEFNLNPLHSNYSMVQQEVFDFVSSLSNNIINNDRDTIKPYEIDILVNNLAIEINGIYWHSFSCIEKENSLKHYNKMLACRNKKLDFLSFTDIEWYNKKEILKSMISVRLNYSGLSVIFARKCVFSEISSIEANQFLDENHLKGSCIIAKSYCLKYNNEIVAIMCYSKPRFNKNYDWELIRVCFKKNNIINGGFEKLFKNSKMFHIGKIVSYSDNDKFNGNSYIKNNFSIKSNNRPSYYYWKGEELLSRYKCQKHKLSKLLHIYDPLLTEAENMFINKYRRYWNCGSITWQFINKT